LCKKTIDTLLRNHNTQGFAFLPYNRVPIEVEGKPDISYGDASMSLDYIRKNFPDWEIIDTDYHLADPYQIIVALKSVA
jgi:hypothetical protein